MDSDLPRITIITPCKNGARYLAQAMESVRRQKYANLEHIVMDCCSTDGTLDLLARYPDTIVVSEPDHSSHDALNKGIARSTGDIIGVLNVDDLYADDILAAVGKTFAADATIDIAVGHSLVFQENMDGLRRVLMAHTHRMDDGLWLPELTFGIPGICGCFFRRRVLTAVAQFQTEYVLAADRRLLIALKLAGVKSRQIDRPAILYRYHAGSATINPGRPNLQALSREYFRMAAEAADEATGRASARRVLLAWQAFEGVKLLVRHLRAQEFSDAAKVLPALARQNLSLPVSLARALRLRRAVKRVNREDELSFRAARRARSRVR